MAGLENGVREFHSCKSIDPVDGVFGPPLDPLQKCLYQLIQVQCGIPCQMQVFGACEGQERVLEEILAGLEGGVLEVNTCKYIDFIVGVFGPPQEPLEKNLYLLIQVQRGSLCQLQVTVALGVQEIGLEELLVGLYG